MLYRTAADLDVTPLDQPAVPRPQRVLLTTPQHFDVEYVINPHMEGHAGTVNRDAAQQQWTALKTAYENVGVEPVVVDGAAGLPDMVFCANQTLPYHRPGGDERGVVLSRMHAEQRRPEVSHYARFFERQDYRVHPLPDGVDGSFEGMGDALWHPGRWLLWGGHGFRSDPDAYAAVADLLDVPIILLGLDDPDFYHLDTCLSVLDERSALIYPGAFDDDGRALIERGFDRVIEAPDDEARRLFACNAHCPDGKHVLIQEGCAVTNERLRAAGFTPVPLDTSEFLKAGGSVFCMKQMMW